MNCLYTNGYKNISGIEINKEAVNLLLKTFPYMEGAIETSSLEERLPKISDNQYDLIFSMAVLEHISVQSEFIFNEIKRISSKFIVTIEDEVTFWSERHFPRNYKKIFESDNWVEIYSDNCENLNCLDDRFVVRVFENKLTQNN